MDFSRSDYLPPFVALPVVQAQILWRLHFSPSEPRFYLKLILGLGSGGRDHIA
jgi:hypothetical protein